MTITRDRHQLNGRNWEIDVIGLDPATAVARRDAREYEARKITHTELEARNRDFGREIAIICDDQDQQIWVDVDWTERTDPSYTVNIKRGPKFGPGEFEQIKGFKARDEALDAAKLRFVDTAQ